MIEPAVGDPTPAGTSPEVPAPGAVEAGDVPNADAMPSTSAQGTSSAAGDQAAADPSAKPALRIGKQRKYALFVGYLGAGYHVSPRGSGTARFTHPHGARSSRPSPAWSPPPTHRRACNTTPLTRP